MNYKLRVSSRFWDPLKKNYKERYLLVKDISQQEAQAILHNFRPPDTIPKTTKSGLSTRVPKAEDIREEV